MKVYDANALKIYVDGSSHPNPGIGGIGMVIRFPDSLDLPDVGFSEGYKETNNNRMEITACIKAFEWLQQNAKAYKITRAIVITDSQYVFNHKDSIQYWKKDGWKNSSGRPYENPDLWDQFLKEWQKVPCRVSIEHEKGKTNDVLKNVDRLAKSGRFNAVKEDRGFVRGKITRTTVTGGKAATLFPAAGQTEIIKIYKYRVMGKGESEQTKITFDLYSAESNAFIEKYVAYTTINLSDTHRFCYQALFNTDQKYPLIEELIPCANPTKNKEA